MQNNPYDDIFKNLAKIMEDIFKSTTTGNSKRFIGYTIITGPGDIPRVIRTNGDSHSEIPYEVVEGPDKIYITVELPPDMETAPYVDIMAERVLIHVDKFETVVDLKVPIDFKHSSYNIRRGILDIMCKKL